MSNEALHLLAEIEDDLFGAFKPRHTEFIGNQPPAERNFTKIKDIFLAIAVAAVIAGSGVAYLASVGGFSPAISPVTVISEPVTPKQDPLLQISGSKQDVASQLIAQGETFLALAVTMENIKTKPYLDAAGKLTIGIGYCIPERLKMLGEDGVRRELQQVGMSTADAAKLVSRSNYHGIEISTGQALKLLSFSAPLYKKISREWVGEEKFDRLNDKQQSALTWLAFNVGGNAIKDFTRLRHAVHAKDPHKVAKNIAPWYHANHKWHKNERAGEILGAVYSDTKPKQKKYASEVAPFEVASLAL